MRQGLAPERAVDPVNLRAAVQAYGTHEVAEALGVSQSQISAMANGKAPTRRAYELAAATLLADKPLPSREVTFLVIVGDDAEALGVVSQLATRLGLRALVQTVKGDV